MIFDTHTHYDDHKYDEDREAVLASLSSYGVGKTVNVAADMESVYTTLELSKSHDFIYAALGVHPDGVGELTESDMDTLKALIERYALKDAKDPEKPGDRKVVAVGEIGLDYCGRDIPPEIQKKWFLRQLELSEETGLPVIVHSRDAAKDTLDILKARGKREGQGIIHCFSYSREMAREFLNLGYYIALGGVVTFKNGRVAKEVAAYVPEDRLLLETDCPYLSPVPHRGERNFSGNLQFVAETIAEIRGVSKEEIIEKTRENACRLYRIP